MISVVALALSLAFTASAFGANVVKAKTKADCEKAGGTWDAQKQTCSGKKM
jgi:hypothetical protein